MKQKVAIIILNWNGKQDTLECLSSVEKISDDDFDSTTIVVDNASSDGAVSVIKKRHPEVVLIENEKNLGFAGGNNRGIEYGMQHQADWFWILNNDTTVDKHALSELVKYCDAKKVGIGGSKIYFSAGHEFHHDRYQEKERGRVLWYAGGTIDWNNVYGSHRGVDEVDQGHYDKVEETMFVTGCSMFISRRCIESIGMFDERYFAYLEDMDLSLRAQRAGFKTIYVPTSIVWHNNAGSTSRPGNALHQYYITRNRLLFGLRYAQPRTKFALVREAFRFAARGTAAEKQAVIDAAMGKWGKRFTW